MPKVNKVVDYFEAFQQKCHKLFLFPQYRVHSILLHLTRYQTYLQTAELRIMFSCCLFSRYVLSPLLKYCHSSVLSRNNKNPRTPYPQSFSLLSFQKSKL